MLKEVTDPLRFSVIGGMKKLFEMETKQEIRGFKLGD